MEIQPSYNVFLDYKGYIIDRSSYRVFPSPLFGSKFSTGRFAYKQMDFWQIGAMTDFTKGINQQFMEEPSQYFESEGIDVSRRGEFRLERDLEAVTLPASQGKVTARFRNDEGLFLGTDTGFIFFTSDGVAFSNEFVGTGDKIISFYEITSPSGRADSGTATSLTESTPGGESSGDFTKLGIVTGTFIKNETTGETGIVTTVSSNTVNFSGMSTGFATGDVYSFGVGGTFIFATRGRKVQLHRVADNTWSTASNVADLFFVEVESGIGQAVFIDGVRQTTDGFTFSPLPVEGKSVASSLWSLPIGQGEPLNAVLHPRGLLIGFSGGIWRLTGGAAGVRVWRFDDFRNSSNFKGMDNWVFYTLFSVEKQGIFYTDGAGVYPTFLNVRELPFVFESCRSISVSGYNIFALVKDTKGDWFLMRSNMTYSRSPKYWWVVKKLFDASQSVSATNREPSYTASFTPLGGEPRVFVFFDDQTAEVYKEETGKFQSSGFIITSLIDERLVKLQKFYHKLSAIFDSFPILTTAKIGFRHFRTESFTESSFSGNNQREIEKVLRNPTVEQKIQLRVVLETSSPTNTPVVTDLTWTYHLETPSTEGAILKNFSFTIIAEDNLEKWKAGRTGGTAEEIGRDKPRERSDILNDVYATRAKKEILNFVGADSKRELAFLVDYTGSGASALMKIDRTNFEMILSVDGSTVATINYQNKTLDDINTSINAVADFNSVVHTDIVSTRTAEDLEPIKDLELKKADVNAPSTDVYASNDVHAIIFNANSPSQIKLGIDGRGSDRLQIGLREVQF